MTSLTSKYTVTDGALIVADRDESGAYVELDRFEIAPVMDHFSDILAGEGLSKKLQADTSEIKLSAGQTFADKVAGMREVYERLCRGEWTAPREAGTRIPALLPQAVAKVFGHSLDKATELVYSAKSETISKLKENDDIIAAMKEAAAARAASSEPNELDELVS